MARVDALRMADHVRDRLVDLAVAENYVRDEGVSDAIRQLWHGSGSKGGLVSELWVEGAYSSESSNDTLRSLDVEGIFPSDLCSHVDSRGVFPATRPLYWHQSQAIRRAAEPLNGSRPTFVITAGTGHGKTEAFLLPMLSDLWTASARRRDGGMRCLILYPMNALVADQVDRIYEWLKGQDRLSVFHFTSATPEDHRAANQQGEPYWEKCRIRTREEARGFETHDGMSIDHEPYGTVPDIVITNYSMLEYMLCRPQDSRFFGPDLSCIILDEAHLYSGVLAADIMMLLRRLRDRCGVSSDSVLHIATSATLGGSSEDLRDFASAIFSSERDNTSVIKGRLAEHRLGDTEAPSSTPADLSAIAKLARYEFSTLQSDTELVENDSTAVQELSEHLKGLVSSAVLDQALEQNSGCPARFLHTALQRAPLIRSLANILGEEKGKAISLEQLAGYLFGGRTELVERTATISLLRLASAARSEPLDMPLIPHRLHFLVRAPEGLSLCLNPRCSGPQKYKVGNVGCLQPYADRCRYCEHIILPVHRCENCGQWSLAGHENQESFCLEPDYYASTDEGGTYYLLTRQVQSDLEEVVIDTEIGEMRGHGAEGTVLWKAPRISPGALTQECPTCKSIWSISANGSGLPEWTQNCRGLIGGRGFALSVIAETVLHDLPAIHGGSKNWKPAEGRRLLCFSDSRSAAARLGPRLTQQHEMQIIRAAMARTADTLTPQDVEKFIRDEVKQLQNKVANSGTDAGLKQYLERQLSSKLEELKRAQAGTSFADFVGIVSKRPEIEQICDRESGEKHRADSFGQSDWRRNSKAVREHIEALIAKELERPLKRRVSVESAGLLEVVYPGVSKLTPPPSLEERLPKEARKELHAVWPDMITLLLDSARSDGCVDWSEQRSNREWLGESPLAGRWLTRTGGGWNCRAFVGATARQLRRKFAASVLGSAGCAETNLDELSRQTLCAIFDHLYALANGQSQGFTWIERDEYHQTGPETDDRAIRIKFDALSLRKPSQLYMCKATRTVWTRTAVGWAPIEGCRGTLQTISSAELDDNPRWGRARRELVESGIFSVGLWAEEHSAQLSPQENQRLQNLFRSGIRNVLSSTTTMELGVDIGGLNGVLLSNVPPGPANHQQRAGRAGRRSDGSAVVVTYARSTQYDREVFRNFGDFIKKPLRKPTVASGREDIIRRHLQAVLLSEFIRSKQPSRTGAMHAFGRMGKLCGVEPPMRWYRQTDHRPMWQPDSGGVDDLFLDTFQQLEASPDPNGRLEHLAARTPLGRIADAQAWGQFIRSAEKLFRKAILEWREDILQLREAWDEIPVRPSRMKGREMAKANSIRYMAKALCDITVIEWLANKRFLPRYGFPINLQSLTVRKAIEGKDRARSVPDERYQLERSSLLALREYIPESRVLVGGRVATSRGLRKHWTDSNIDAALGLEYYALECSEGHVYVRQSRDDPCPRCGGEPIGVPQRLVFPRFGFTTAGWETPPLGTNLERIGEQTVSLTAFAEYGDVEITEEFAGIAGLRATYRKDTELLVRNAGKNNCGFAICTRCGFSMSEETYGQGRMNLPARFDQHASLFSPDPSSYCWGKNERSAPVLRNRVLSARELTNMILLEWPAEDPRMFNALYSLGRALVLGGSRLLELDQRELEMTLTPLTSGRLGIAIYDTAPGGAGHCQKLMEDGTEWIEESRVVLHGSDEHHATCTKACLECILEFSGQYAANRLDRKGALNLLDLALQG